MDNGRRATGGAGGADAARNLAFASYLRVAAMGAVVLIHACSAIVNNSAIRGSTTWWVATALDLGSSWSVPLFMMVSGALLLPIRPGEGARAFYARRLQRIAIPLVIAHLGYLLLRWGPFGERLTITRVVVDLLHGAIYVQLYFFWIILGLYLITPLLRPALAGRSRGELLVIGAACIAWMWAVQASAHLLTAVGEPTQAWQPAALTLFVPYIGYFILGHALRDLVLRGDALLGAIAVFVVGEAIVIIQYGVGGGSAPLAIVAGGGYQGLPVAITAVTAFAIGRSLVRPSSALAGPPFQAPMRHLGELSLGVFMLHLVFLELAWRSAIFKYGVVNQSLPLTLLVWALVTAVSFGVSAGIARIPVLRRTIGF